MLSANFDFRCLKLCNGSGEKYTFILTHSAKILIYTPKRQSSKIAMGLCHLILPHQSLMGFVLKKALNHQRGSGSKYEQATLVARMSDSEAAHCAGLMPLKQ